MSTSSQTPPQPGTTGSPSASSASPTTQSTPPPTSNTPTSSNTPTTEPTSSSAPPTTTTTPTTTSTPPTTTTPSTTSTPPTTSTTAPPTTTAPTTTKPTTSPSRGIVTSVSTAFVTNSNTIGPTANSDNSGGSKGFFSNTGAVAGVFSVVGLIGLAIIIALITNGIRRRRARKFDKELAAATLEAASAPKPVFLDDDDDDARMGGYGGGAAGYGAGAGGGSSGYDNSGYGAFSDASSHGTYGQPPMSIGQQQQESYGMRELQSHHNVQPGEIFDPYAAGAGAAGAAGIGVARARSHRALGAQAGQGGEYGNGQDYDYGAGLQEGGAPYAAFAGPHTQSPPPMPQAYGGGRNTTGLDVMEAAGLGAHVAGAGANVGRSQSMAAPSSQATTPGSDPYGLERNKSLGSYDAYAAYPGQNSNQNSYYGNQQPVPQPYQHSPQGQAQGQGAYAYQPQQAAQPQHTRGYSDADEDDAYGGYVVEDPSPAAHTTNTKTTPGSDNLPNPFERQMAASSQGHGGYGGGSGAGRYDERASSDDGETEGDAEPPRRVLKVANE